MDEGESFAGRGPHGHSRADVVRSPGLLLGVAAGDEIELDPREKGAYRLVSRSGHLCIQVFRESGIEECEPALTQAAHSLGGHLDGCAPMELVYTVPLAAGFERVQEAFDRAIAGFPEASWHYGNVYDPKDGTTPLDWWRSTPYAL